MKKSNFLAVWLCVCPAMLFGQLKVQSDGKTVVYSSATAPVGSAQFSVITGNIGKGLSVQNTQESDVEIKGIFSVANGMSANTHNLIGIHGTASKAYEGQGVSIGVFGTVGWTQNGKNYGVYGALPQGIFHGSGIIGYAPYASDVSFAYPNLTTPYAGYFRGAVTITDLLNAPVATWNSDYRYKQNITELDKEKTVDNLLRLNPVAYNFKQRYVEASDSLGKTIEIGYFDEKSPVFQKKHYGLIAQEVQKIYPDLVYEDGDGYLSVDYVGIIPLLIQSVKEQQTQIETQQQQINQLVALTGAKPIQKSIANETNSTTPQLLQNVPNPFNAQTEIGYYIPETVQRANLYIYDLNGIQKRQFSIAERGEGAVTLQASSLTAGIYFYTLLCDGKPVDTKQMILTK